MIARKLSLIAKSVVGFARRFEGDSKNVGCIEIPPEDGFYRLDRFYREGNLLTCSMKRGFDRVRGQKKPWAQRTTAAPLKEKKHEEQSLLKSGGDRWKNVDQSIDDCFLPKEYPSSFGFVEGRQDA